MNLIITSIAAILLIIGIVYQTKPTSQTPDLTKESDPAPTPSVTEIIPENNKQLIPTLKPTEADPSPVKPTSQPTLKQQSSNWYYPGASVIESQGKQTKLHTSDSPEQVTDWYKEKISEQGFRAISIAESTANDTTQNKLSAAREGENIKVSIERNSQASPTTITITINS